MILKTINIFLLTVVSLLTLYLIEGACYRLVEPYAKWRLGLSWGSPDQAKENSLLKKFHFDHFALPPMKSPIQSALSSRLDQEFDYSRKAISFNRPTRDRYFNYISRQANPLRRFEIVDLEKINEVVLPGMRKPAELIDVELGLARRAGMPVDYSKGIFVYSINPVSRTVYEAEFARLESTFSFLLNHGIACVLLSTESAHELSTKLKFLKKKHPNLSEKIFIYAQGDAVQKMDRSIRENNQLLSGVIVKDPSVEISFVNGTPSWFMGILSKREMDEKILDSMLQRVSLNRGHLNPYQSRLSGLLIEESKFEESPISSYAIAYILNCLEFYSTPDLVLNNTVSNGDSNMSLNPALSVFAEENITDSYTLDLPDDAEPNFECEIINEYRLLNVDDPEISNTSNRELVLQIGSSFEEMGEDVLQQIAERDPIFYRYYLSLKEIHRSQN